MMDRVVLLGMNNPLSEDPSMALFPHPEGCTGWRIWAMLHEEIGISRLQYLHGFDRRNLLDLRRWSAPLAEIMAPDVWASLRDRQVIVLGAATLECLQRGAWGLEGSDLPRPPELMWQESHGARWCWCPHPSGRSLWYNEPMHRAALALRLTEMYLLSREGPE